MPPLSIETCRKIPFPQRHLSPPPSSDISYNIFLHIPFVSAILAHILVLLTCLYLAFSANSSTLLVRNKFICPTPGKSIVDSVEQPFQAWHPSVHRIKRSWAIIQWIEKCLPDVIFDRHDTFATWELVCLCLLISSPKSPVMRRPILIALSIWVPWALHVFNIASIANCTFLDSLSEIKKEWWLSYRNRIRVFALYLVNCWLEPVTFAVSPVTGMHRKDLMKIPCYRTFYCIIYMDAIFVPAMMGVQAKNLIASKWDIVKWGKDNNFPVVITHNRCDDQGRWEHPTAVLPKNDLWIKCDHGTHGSGGVPAYFNSQTGLYHLDISETNNESKGVTSQEILDRFSSKAKQTGNDFVVGDLVRNHAVIRRTFGVKSLCTCRIATVMDKAHNTKIYMHIFRFATNVESLVDNTHAGGVCSVFDLETGVLGPAMDLNAKNVILNVPLTGASLKSVVLPYWHEAVNICVKAHQNVGCCVMIGWDIALTDTGPVIIEANVGGADLAPELISSDRGLLQEAILGWL